ncbi:hypothetical protein JRO89_XS04G0026700 [Xanthoceras sorbifolium]|uniref:Carboxypeptidase n=1 Tax=Xanthoceras sorbifolium TaxID=99658 RepID=A0ABQ8I487_9ROSI|nr:hypothetical protein JRO89_XS04G0026700 [Xanthoceras sorbifolium]
MFDKYIFITMDKFFSILSLCMLFTVVVIEAAPESAFVTHLPGFNGTFPSKHYSGYVSIENQGGVLPPKNLFYYFVESERDPSKDPLVLWLNGGPGCSSMDGFIYEHGPFNFAKEKSQTPTLHLNPYSWSKWLKQYEEFSSNPFYISGESYAGIYIPTLAAQVHHGIKAGENPVINFKGYLIGNGVTDPEFDGNALVPFAHGMGLISDDIYEEVKAACGGKYYSQPNTSDTCSEELDKVDTAIASLNIYDILEPCYHDPSSTNKNDASNLKNKNNNISSSFLHELGKTERPLSVRTRMFGRAWPFKAPVMPGVVPSWPELLSYGSVPCVNDEVATAWLNDESVRKALHVAPKDEIGEWQLCTDLYYTNNAGSMLNYHKNLTIQGYRALIYSGDHDMCVPFTGSQAWTRSLGYKIVDEWRAWYSSYQEVASGYLQGYDHNLTFLTIKGAGHTVPEYKPRESLEFFRRWLDGEKI